ncbi:MAG: conjugal transfer protein TraX [Candidatus Bathyarchaeota archaeon]|nr:conjugal transfer protein TraX [Candidatus Bathyarchaeota archaeon]
MSLPARKFDYGRDLLKLIAVVTMAIDHIGDVFYPDWLMLHIIGRLAFPLFAYLVVLGIESTKKSKRYLATLFGFAVISQVPYFLAFEIQPFERFNILFSLILGALTIYFFNKRSLWTIVPVLLSIIFNVEGGIYVVLTVACMKLLKNNPLIGFLALFALNSQFLLIADTQVLSLFAVTLILLHIRGVLKSETFIPESSFAYSFRKYAFYAFYPLHLATLFLIKLVFF